MKYDKSLYAMLIGVVQFIPIELYTQIMKHFNLTTVSAFDAMSMMWFKEGSWLIGFFAAFGLGSWAGLATYHSTKILGRDYLPIKAMLIGMTMQSLLFNIFGVLGGNTNLAQNVSGNLVHTSSAAMGSILVGLLIERFLLNKENAKLKLHSYKVIPAPARRIEDKGEFIKPRKIGAHQED